ncbi:PQQ-dependent sugar dehydrogenase [Mobilitalea sibirica]|uniref:PQQ-dependent sugar dehydrogenase n=2 Tax=Mobilitalea sibirica TaxID=1462919 RepID=A0A8J7HDS7_9FIRM|nr:PQQ-dependent sugar dehydrogenase [Mobilitalea sibirica]
MYIQQIEPTERYLNPEDVNVPQGYQIEVFATGLDTPIGLVFTEEGGLLVAEAGVSTGNPRVLFLVEGRFEVIADGFNVPITGINYRNGDIYVSHRGVITILREDGTREDIISGLPSFGDFSNNNVTFGPEGKIYFGQGTATNSGVVGLDNQWIFEHPYFHDQPGDFILARGVNYETTNAFIPAAESAMTGPFRPYGEPSLLPVEVVRGTIEASGSILRANPDGSDLELVAWGLRNPSCIKFDLNNNLYIANQGMTNRGSRPIANAPDEFHMFVPNQWYGWPDFSAGMPVSAPRFTPEGRPQPELLLYNIPSVPPRPLASFPANSYIMGFDFNYSSEFGPVGDAYIAEFGSIRYEETGELILTGIGHRISRININTGQTSTFSINKSGFPAVTPLEGGLGRPTDVKFGPDGAMYVTDFTATTLRDPNEFIPNTGVIWRISRSQF